MKIPKYIEKLINTRANLASQFNNADYRLSKWLDKNGIEAESCDFHGGVEALVNPWDSAKRVKQAIEDK